MSFLYFLFDVSRYKYTKLQMKYYTIVYSLVPLSYADIYNPVPMYMFREDKICKFQPMLDCRATNDAANVPKLFHNFDAPENFIQM